MFKKKSKQPEEGVAEKPNKPAKAAAPGSARSIASYLITPLLIGVMVLLGVAAADYFLASAKRQATNDQAGESIAQVMAGGLRELVTGHIQLAQTLADDPALVADAGAGEAALAARAEQLLQRLPKGYGLNLLPAGWNKPDQNRHPPLSFAALDLLRRVEKSGRALGGEIHLVGSPNQHLAQAAPVKDVDGKVVATVHLTAPMALIQRQFDALPGRAGQYSLQQVAGGKRVTLAGNSPSTPSADATASVVVDGTIWEVGYWPASGGGSLDDLLIPGLALVGIAILAAVVFLQLSGLRKALKLDQGNFVRTAEAAVSGTPGRPLPVALAENQQTMQLLAQLASGIKRGPSKAAAAEGGQAPVSEAGEAIDVALPGDDEEQLAEASKPQPVQGRELNPEIFRAYDIRGVVGETLTEDDAFDIGRAVGSLSHEKGEARVIVGRDGRASSPALADALIKGLQACGRDVIDIGLVPTPVAYFAAEQLSCGSVVMVTGSHNPPEYNGFKIVVAGETLAEDQIQALHTRIARGLLEQGSGSVEQIDVTGDYMQRVSNDISLVRDMKVVVDAGNGVAGSIAPLLFRALGCDVTELYCDVDARFPNHHPDPTDPANLQDLIQAVKEKQADIGFAYDGDGDRLGVVDSAGNIIWADQLLMLLAADVLIRHPGADIIYDVKSTKHLATHVLSTGGRPIMWKTGHSLMKAKMRETGALLGGEFSGHIFFKERWYGFDDGIYASMRLLEVLAGDGRDTAEVFAELPQSVSTPELQATVPEGQQYQLVHAFMEQAEFPGAKLIDLDGLRVEYSEGWGLLRASNTTPKLTFRFEADSQEALGKLQALFKQQLLKVSPELQLPF